jgi:hypothetical protein
MRLVMERPINFSPVPLAHYLTSHKQEINNKKEVESGDAAVTLKFLRSAVFYLLTDHDNIGNHLRAVQNILDFSAEERAAVERLLRHGYFL